MQISKHACMRQQQRAIPESFIDLILHYGTPVTKPGKALEYRLYNKERIQLIRGAKQLIQKLDKCAKKGVLVNADTQDVITVYNIKRKASK
jgi:hypothetical protein